MYSKLLILIFRLHKRNCQQKIASLVYRITKGAEVEQEVCFN